MGGANRGESDTYRLARDLLTPIGTARTFAPHLSRTQQKPAWRNPKRASAFWYGENGLGERGEALGQP